MDAPNETRKKQMKFTAIVVVGFIGLLVFGMWISDPNAGKPSPIEVAQEKAKEVSKSYTAPSSTITAEDAWVAKSEGELADLKAQQKLLMDEIERLRESTQSNQTRQPIKLMDWVGLLAVLQTLPCLPHRYRNNSNSNNCQFSKCRRQCQRNLLANFHLHRRKAMVLCLHRRRRVALMAEKQFSMFHWMTVMQQLAKA
jgi:hypothetical protein